MSQFVTSSVLGVDLNNSSTTALFTLGQTVLGTNGSQWVYCIATGTITTGKLVSVQADGTMIVPTTSILLAPSGAAGGGALGFIQCQALQGEYAWVATGGKELIIACSGTVAPAAVLYAAAEAGTPGALVTTANSLTMAGIYITTSASTAGVVTTARGTVTYPRSANPSATPLQ